LRPDLAIDLGTAATRVHVASRTVPLTRPSTVWREGGSRPALRQGVIVDADAAAGVLGELLRRAGGTRWRRPHALACVPTDANEAERAAVVEAVQRAGASTVAIVVEPLAAAASAGLAPEAKTALALVDVGEGVTDCAVVREGRLVASAALRIALADLRATVRAWLDEGLGIRVSPVEAERVLREAGVGRGWRTPHRLHVVGSPAHGIGPLCAWLEVDALHAALDPVAERIASHVAAFVAGLPADLAADVSEAGVSVTGGGALLAGMVERLVGELGLAVRRVPDPLLAVVDGARVLAGAGCAAAVATR